MIEIKGACNTAIAYTDNVEPSAAGQIRTLCDQPFVAGSVIRIMPDVHAGAGCTIGTTMTIADKIIPNLVGVDIGCGMEVARIDTGVLDCERLDRVVREEIPSGFEIRKKAHPFADEIDVSALRCAKHIKLERAIRSIGTLGGGNHFIEANRDENGGIYVVVHSGSRHLGLEVANYYQRAGYDSLNGRGESDRQKLIETYRAAGRDKEIKRALAALKKGARTKIPQALAYVEGDLFDDYIHDMKLTQRYAELNRKAMMRQIVRGLGVKILEQFTTIHNYIDTERMILRKGAVSAQSGEKLIIPMNMRDGSLLCVGRGNPEWNFSAPHGAGRLMSRTEAKKNLDMAEYKRSMAGIYSTSVSRETLDEAPMAYKAMGDILRQIGETVDIVARITPLYNFKAAE